MKRTSFWGLALALGLLLVGGTAYAHMSGYGGNWGMMGGGYGYGQGNWGMMGNGYGHMMDNGYYGDNGYYQQNSGALNELHQKQAELNKVLSAPEINTAKAKELQSQINELREQLNREQVGPGYHMGYGYDGSYGPGNHWR